MALFPRVALFADSYHEANGVARTTTALAEYAARHNKPMLVVHAGPTTRILKSGSVVRLQLGRCPVTSVALEHDLWFDLALWHHTRKVARILRGFRADVLHFTGPSDIGQIGVYLGRRLGIPMVGSWHTNLHEYASRRLQKHLGWLRPTTRRRLLSSIEERVLQLELLFYRIPRAILAPNHDLHDLLCARLGKPTFLMTRGVDTELFSPSKRSRTDSQVKIGYVGRLSPEKNVRVLPELERALLANGHRSFRFTIVGEGNERQWLSRHMQSAEFLGVLRGEALAAAYANMDVFAFPSETETVGNVILEAMASGVPVVGMARGGPRSIDQSGRAMILAEDKTQFIQAVDCLVNDASRRLTMQMAARALATERSWDRIFEAVYRAYAASAPSAAAAAAHQDAAVAAVGG